MGKYLYPEIREEMARIARLMWDRRLTNAAGGNFAVRAEHDRVLISPSMMSEEKHCQMDPDDFLLIDYRQNLLEGSGSLSRESLMHVLILQNFREIGCTIHAHPFYCMPFVAQGKEIPNVTEATLNRGCVGCVPYTKAYTEELSVNVYRYFESKRELAERKPIGVVMSGHGVVVSGPDIFKVYSMLERIECDAYCVTVQNHIPPFGRIGSFLS